ncbi:hypothetical protein BZM27_16110 [Paraburkholderia steynii]|uniref:Uncharacterized protein n=1 Tax=Paraburkholderia steynii TaxID=1245441 RepID=A0A4R0XIR2_9BURK|nr:hypothetical protein BZM27_16110 [Paraburkholderia steynii]
MNEFTLEIREALSRLGTATITAALARRGIRNVFMQGVAPLSSDQRRMVGIAYTMRFLPAREDKSGPTALNRGQIQVQAMEQCPPGGVLVIDSRGDARAASAGDLYIGRLKQRGCAGIVTDGGLRDSDGILKTGLPAFQQRPASPPNSLVHLPIDLNLPIACGGVAVFPGDVVVGDRDGVVVVPIELAEAVVQEGAASALYEEFADEQLAQGRALPGLFPNADDETKHAFESWKHSRAS